MAFSQLFYNIIHKTSSGGKAQAYIEYFDHYDISNI